MTAPARKNLRPADDQPFDFNLNAVRAEVDLSPWRILWGPDNKRWTFRHLEELDEWSLVAAADKGEGAAMMAIFKEALGDQWAEFRKIPMPRYAAKELWKRYREHCGIEEGESNGSTDS